MPDAMRIVILGLSITSSWGNGHATNYRGLVRALAQRGHDVLFLERDRPWYADNRDLARPRWGTTRVYRSLEQLRDRFAREVRDADAVIVGSYVPKGVQVGAIVRGLHTEGAQPQVLMAHHDTLIESNDHVIVFLPHKRMVREVERQFQVSATFF